MTSEEQLAFEARIHELLGSIRRDTEFAVSLNKQWMEKNSVSQREQREIMNQLYSAIRHWHRNIDYCVEDVEFEGEDEE